MVESPIQIDKSAWPTRAAARPHLRSAWKCEAATGELERKRRICEWGDGARRVWILNATGDD
eukprot:scaffold2286_cov240-Pinguiococcus_pyrenoidosus.AAC.3